MIDNKIVFELISKDKSNLIKIAKSVRVDFEGILGYYIVFDKLPIKEALLKVSDDIVEEFKDKEELWNEIINDLNVERVKKMKKYKCIAKCPELDCNNEKHCTFTESYLKDKREYDREVCPCGNIEKLELIEDSEEESGEVSDEIK